MALGLLCLRSTTLSGQDELRALCDPHHACTVNIFRFEASSQ